MAPPAHRATTATVAALNPFLASPGLGSDAPYIGQEQSGGAFCFDPWNLYQAPLTNPNVLVAGRIGRGKSALVKTMLWRGVPFRRRAAVLDPKGEYGPLARALGIEPIRLAPGSPARLNPLDPGPGAAELGAREVARRQLGLLQSVAGAALGRELVPIERAACRLALAAVGEGASVPTVPLVADALLHPTDAAAAELRMTPIELVRASQDVALELGRLCDGELAGMFDGESTVVVDWDGPLVVLDLSAMGEHDGLAILMACATAWLQAAVFRKGAGRRYVVVDEAWRLLSHLATARWLRASLKLAREYGVANILVLHRLSDLLAAGDASSEQRALAEGLLADTETRIIYAQAEGEIGATAELLGLSRTERARLPTLEVGAAIWKVAGTSYWVDHRRSRQEASIIDTDAAMVVDSPEFGISEGSSGSNSGVAGR